jgi:hypothetical protein
LVIYTAAIVENEKAKFIVQLVKNALKSDINLELLMHLLLHAIPHTIVCALFRRMAKKILILLKV